MTPQEKAKELYSKFLRYVPAEEEFEHEYAKQCALIAVDEIIANIEPSVSMDVISARIKYWEEVKQEIEKL
jgi:2,3-bisphosphoglycerate-independent phosphoglycerate mutase